MELMRADHLVVITLIQLVVHVDTEGVGEVIQLTTKP